MAELDPFLQESGCGSFQTLFSLNTATPKGDSVIMPLKNWTEAQSQIHTLYIVQHQTLRRVKELMLRTYGFDAS